MHYETGEDKTGQDVSSTGQQGVAEPERHTWMFRGFHYISEREKGQTAKSRRRLNLNITIALKKNNLSQALALSTIVYEQMFLCYFYLIIEILSN